MTATRRLAAVLTADVARYSRLMGADEEGTLTALKALRRDLVDPKITAHRGRTVKTTGDGLLVEFASVVDAVRCAVAVQRAMAERNTPLPPDRRIEFRIGLNLGDVILDEGDIFGDGVNIAARLEALAEPGEICVSRVVRDQVRDKLDVPFEDQGEQFVKNITRPVHVYRIPIGERMPASARRVGTADAAFHRPEASAPTPADIFVGRQHELDLLRGSFERACAGHGRLIMLAGEPGIGKTRTAQELASHAARREAAVLWGRCHEEAGAPPYWPWVQVIGAVLNDGDPGVVASLGPGASDIAEIVPALRDLLPGLERSAPLGDPAEARFRLFESIRLFLTNLSRQRTVLIVLDDLHWADAPSLRLLEFLAPAIAASRILLAGTYRATELSRRHPLSNSLGALARARHFVRVNLSGLSAEEVEAFIAAAATSAPAGLAEALHHQTEGNPLFLREIVRFLEQRGALDPGLDAADGGVPPTIRIPEGVTEVIGRRLNFLSAGCNEVLALASVIGREFTWEVLLRAAAPLGDDMLIEALDEAVAAHVVEETAEGRYQFAHNLIRMTLYDELRIARRRQFHRDIGAAIELVHQADLGPFLPELARHFQAAGNDADATKAIDYAARAGRRADEMLAFEDATQFFQVALDAIAPRAEPDDAMRCQLLIELGEAQRKSSDFFAALATLREAAEIAGRLGRPDLLAQAALLYEAAAWRVERPADAPPEGLLADALRLAPESDIALKVELMGALARSLLQAGMMSEARGYLDRAIPMARRLGDPALLAKTLNYLFDFPWRPRQTCERLAEVNEVLALAERTGNTELAGHARWRRVNLHLELADIAAADDQLLVMRSQETELRQPFNSFIIRSQLATLALMRGNLPAAEQLIAEAARRAAGAHSFFPAAISMQIFALRREQGRLKELGPVLAHFLRNTSAAATWRPGLALLYVELDRLDDARTEFETLTADDLGGVPRDGRWTTCLAYLTEITAALGDGGRAEMLYQELRPYAGIVLVLGGGLVCCGSSDRHLGLLCTTMRRWSEAERHFAEALSANERIGARLPLAHTQHDYAAMLLSRGTTGDRQRAIALLRSSLDSADELGLRALAERVAARLHGLSDASSPASSSDTLTARESEVLGLIAIGRSNADIATVLSISLNTVASHVRSILAKTGCANRTEAAAYAMRNGLPQARP